MNDLIADLRQAEEGLWELDTDIGRLLGWTHQGAHIWRPPDGHDQLLPHFTRDPGDALKWMVPKGEWVTLEIRPEHSHCDFPDRNNVDVCNAATPELALCIASLLARSQS